MVFLKCRETCTWIPNELKPSCHSYLQTQPNILFRGDYFSSFFVLVLSDLLTIWQLCRLHWALAAFWSTLLIHFASIWNLSLVSIWQSLSCFALPHSGTHHRHPTLSRSGIFLFLMFFISTSRFISHKMNSVIDQKKLLWPIRSQLDVPKKKKNKILKVLQN